MTDLSPNIVTQVVRVATSTNFNCTKKEWEQLEQLSNKTFNSVFFINCNINTPLLKTVNDHPYKVIITINPDLTVSSNQIKKLLKIDKNKIAFLRVKYLPNEPKIKQLIEYLAYNDYAVVVTLQRWNGIKNLEKYTNKKYYAWSHNRFRLAKEPLKVITDFTDSFIDKKVFICDRLNIGCKGCRLCSFLTTGKNLKISSIDLSSSGICKFNCPDCYAKTMQNMSIKFGNNPLVFDKIKINIKQAGHLVHNKDTLKQLEKTNG